MFSKPLVAGVLAAGCLTAAAGGAYVAVRQNAGEGIGGVSAPVQSPAPSRADAGQAQPVAESEGVIAPAAAPVADVEKPAVAPRRAKPVSATPAPASRPASQPQRPARRNSPTSPIAERGPAPLPQPPPDAATVPVEAAAPPPRVESVEPALPAPDVPPAPPEPQFLQVVIPAASVIGLHVETALSSERARIEDRVDARVTRDVNGGGRVAIPAGTRAIGSVVLVERGGKMKERARLGVRFHTLVFADGSEIPIRTDAIFREGESPGNESAKKIGGATVGGAILGAILGGGKGAVIGGATGAAGGTAAVMAGDRNAATLPSGTNVTVRLAEPLFVDVERRSPEL